MKGVPLELVFFGSNSGNGPYRRDCLVRYAPGLSVEFRACSRGLGYHCDEQKCRQDNEGDTCVWQQRTDI